jgi:hypothetical protein
MFPREEPDFFMTDVQVLKESYVHRDCFLAKFKELTR